MKTGKKRMKQPKKSEQPQDISPKPEKIVKEYWTEKTEQAVFEYLKNDFNFYEIRLEKYLDDCRKNDIEIDNYTVDDINNMIIITMHNDAILKKNDIFRKNIEKPLSRLVENIIFNFKLFRAGFDVKTLHNDCMSFVMEKFANFDPSLNTKSFSFYGTVAKHYLLGKKKETDKGSRTNLDYSNFREEVDNANSFELDEPKDKDDAYSLFNFIINELESEIEKQDISKNDLKVAYAIVQIFKNHSIVGIYNKNHIYHLIKENTGLQTKDITYSLSRFRSFYRSKKQEFIKQKQNDDYNDDFFDYEDDDYFL